MKNFLIISLGLVAASGIASAAIATCGSTNYTVSQINAPGFTCEDGDKIFSAFSITSSDQNLVVQFSPLSGPNFNGFLNLTVSDSVSNVLSNGFTLDYTISVDPTLVTGGFNYISFVSTTGTDTSSATATNSVTTGGGCGTISSVDAGLGTGFLAAHCNPTGQPLALNVVDTFATPGGTPTITSVQDTFQQSFQNTSGVPEPGSMMLLGGGLFAVGLIGRKKLVRK